MKDSISKILQRIKVFRDERDWMQFHNPKNMAISIILEASELLEHFQWKKEDEILEYIEENKEEIQDEIADIGAYLFELADNLDIDLIDAMNKKLDKNIQKYPIEKSKGNAKKYTEF